MSTGKKKIRRGGRYMMLNNGGFLCKSVKFALCSGLVSFLSFSDSAFSDEWEWTEDGTIASFCDGGAVTLKDDIALQKALPYPGRVVIYGHHYGFAGIPEEGLKYIEREAKKCRLIVASSCYSVLKHKNLANYDPDKLIPGQGLPAAVDLARRFKRPVLGFMDEWVNAASEGYVCNTLKGGNEVVPPRAFLVVPSKISDRIKVLPIANPENYLRDVRIMESHCKETKMGTFIKGCRSAAGYGDEILSSSDSLWTKFTRGASQLSSRIDDVSLQFSSTRFGATACKMRGAVNCGLASSCPVLGSAMGLEHDRILSTFSNPAQIAITSAEVTGTVYAGAKVCAANQAALRLVGQNIARNARTTSLLARYLGPIIAQSAAVGGFGWSGPFATAAWFKKEFLKVEMHEYANANECSRLATETWKREIRTCGNGIYNNEFCRKIYNSKYNRELKKCNAYVEQAIESTRPITIKQVKDIPLFRNF
jgi:hypothetical protein